MGFQELPRAAQEVVGAVAGRAEGAEVGEPGIVAVAVEVGAFEARDGLPIAADGPMRHAAVFAAAMADPGIFLISSFVYAKIASLLDRIRFPSKSSLTTVEFIELN